MRREIISDGEFFDVVAESSPSSKIIQNNHNSFSLHNSDVIRKRSAVLDIN